MGEVFVGRSRMEAIRRAVAHGNWDRLGASPSAILHLHVDSDAVRLLLYLISPREFISLAYLRMLVSPDETGAFLFEVSLAEYAACNGDYDAVVGLVGDGDRTDRDRTDRDRTDRDRTDRDSISRVRVRIWRDEKGGDDELVVAAGELRPIWRRVTLFPSINVRHRRQHRLQHSTCCPVELELLSGPPPRVLVALLCGRDRTAAAEARTLRPPDGSPPLTWTDAELEQDRWSGLVLPHLLELPDLLEAATRPEAPAARRRCAAITKELMEAVWHPRRVAHLGGVDALDAV